VIAVPLLIAALEVPDERASRAAAEALTEITLQQHGASSRRWLTWWKEHQGRPRADWLLAALTHRDRDVRLAAAEELRAAAEPPVEYFADAPPEERARAAQEWASWWSKNGAQV
jgi:HEAT repeat protein